MHLTKRANARIADIDAKLQTGANVEPLRSLVGQADAAAAWSALILGRKRAIVEALLTVGVHSAGRGNRRNMSDDAIAKTLTVHQHH